jgi:hypothetical protein
MAQAIDERGQDPSELCSTDNFERFVLGFLSEIQKEFTDRTEILYTQISALNDEILGLKLQIKEPPLSSTLASKPESNSAPPPPPPPPSKSAPPTPAPTWAAVAKKAKK